MLPALTLAKHTIRPLRLLLRWLPQVQHRRRCPRQQLLLLLLVRGCQLQLHTSCIRHQQRHMHATLRDGCLAWAPACKQRTTNKVSKVDFGRLCALFMHRLTPPEVHTMHMQALQQQQLVALSHPQWPNPTSCTTTRDRGCCCGGVASGCGDCWWSCAAAESRCSSGRD